MFAASAPYSGDCAGAQELYAGAVADIATIHFDRDISQVEGNWRPVWQPWWVQDCQPPLPVASNNEPIGPGSSTRKIFDGGGTHGVVTGIPEPELTLAVSLRLRELLRRAGVRVVMTRTHTAGQSMGNVARARIAPSTTDQESGYTFAFQPERSLPLKSVRHASAD